MTLLLALACGSAPTVPPADRAAFLERISFPLPLVADPHPSTGEAAAFDGYSVRPLSFAVFEVPGRGPFEAAAALWTPDAPADRGVIVAHGHFGQGKSGPEAQEIAHRLAARGLLVLAVDTPGVEEWEVPGRRIHFDEGAHERAFLAAAGTSAMALQVAILRQGVRVLALRGARRIAAAGASGGAVQAFYLALADDRVEGAVLASYVPIPREARASGCPCDQVPGWPGPDPAVLALLDEPSLWLSDIAQPRPLGLGAAGDFEVHEGPHGFGPAMQRAAEDWIARLLGSGRGRHLDRAPLLDLHTTGPAGLGYPTVFDLPLPAVSPWAPSPWDNVGYELSCEGRGPAVVVAGGDAADRAALAARGLRPCEVRVPDDETGPAEAIAAGRPYADRQAGGLLAAARQSGAVGAWGVRAWGLAAAATGLPFVVRDPLEHLEEVDPARDPAWVHVPGAWQGAVERTLARAAATGDDPVALAETLAAALSGGGARSAEGAGAAPP